MLYISPAKQVTDNEELRQILEVALSGHYAGGIKSEEFGKKLKQFLGIKNVILTNSGSSANLLAVSACLSPKFQKRIYPGDSVITTAVGFPTTVNPLFQNGLRPTFIDAELGTYVPSLDMVLEAITPRTRLIILAHTLGNPFQEKELAEECERREITLIADCCDGLGSTYASEYVGTYADMATLSFYPAHMISCGEGGAVYTRSSLNRVVLESFRDWGRSCYCLPGVDNTCGKRFNWDFEELPYGFDHKYVYEHIGYNLKMSDLNAAVGVAQMDKLPDFIVKRRQNHAALKLSFQEAGFGEYFILPEATPNSDPVWFGFCLTIRDGMPFTRRDLVQYLESHQVGTRQLFGGNLLRHPAYANLDYDKVGSLSNADKILMDSFWVACHPALSSIEIFHIVTTFNNFLKQR